VMWRALSGALPVFSQNMGLGRGLFYSRLSRHIRANADFTAALMIDSVNECCYFYRGLSRLALREYEVAKEDFTKLISLAPKVFIAHYYLGICQEQLNQEVVQ
jgi:tetratricopeptide (TPR) repeat protein